MGLQRLASKAFIFFLALFLYLSLKAYNLTPDSQHNPKEFFLSSSQVKQVKESFESKQLIHHNSSIQLSNQTDVEKLVDAVHSDSDENCRKKWLGLPPSISNTVDARDFNDVTCEALLFGNISDPNNKEIYNHAKKFMDEHKRKSVSDSYFLENIQDIGCTQFKISRGYHLNPWNKEEEEFPIAYNMLIHHDIWQVESLLRSIYRPQNSYCIHLDAKVKPELQESVRALASCFKNVYIASRLEKVMWAGYSRLQADINCMKDQVKRPIQWKYLLNVAGQAFPLKSNLEMVKILKIYNGANDIEGIHGKRVHRSRFENEWKEEWTSVNAGKVVKTGKKNPKPPYNIDIVRGSAYGVFSREFVEWLLNDEKAKALLEWSQKTWSPDEHYWATLHHQYVNPHIKSPGGYLGEPNSKPWLAVWVAWGGVSPCHGRWMRGVCVLGIEDLPSLMGRHEFIVNKLSIDTEPLGLECLNRWIEYKTQCPPKIDEDYYKKLPFILKS